MSGEPTKKYRKYWIIAVMALFVGVLAVALADEALDVAGSVNASTNITALQNNDTADRAYVNNTFLPLAGGNMTGRVNFGLNDNEVIDVNVTAPIGYPNDDKIINISHNSKVRTYLRTIGIQAWQLNNTVSELGWIEYTTPGAAPPHSTSSGIGILFRPITGSNINISRIVNYPEGLVIQVFNQTAATAYTVFFNRTDGSFIINSLIGTGNAYPITSDATGRLQVNRSAGAGITMKSPDGNSWCLTVTNGGTTLATSGACS